MNIIKHPIWILFWGESLDLVPTKCYLKCQLNQCRRVHLEEVNLLGRKVGISLFEGESGDINFFGWKRGDLIYQR